MSVPAANSQSTILGTTLAIVAAYESRNIEEIMAFRTSDCTNHILPTSLNRAIFENATYRIVFEGVYKGVSNFKLNIDDIIEDVQRNKVVL